MVATCRDEAGEAGLIEIEGRLTRKPVLAADAPLDELRKRDQEIAAAESGSLHGATIADCAAALDWAHTS